MDPPIPTTTWHCTGPLIPLLRRVRLDLTGLAPPIPIYSAASARALGLRRLGFAAGRLALTIGLR